MKIRLWIFVFLFVVGGLCQRAVFAGESKFAYVDVGKIFDEFEKTKKFDQELQQEGRGKQEKRDAIVYEVRRLRDEQALLTEEKKKETQTKIEAKLKELEQFDEKAQGELSEKRNTIMKDIFSDIDNVVKGYGERKGYDLVFNERALLYKNPSFDKTDDILKELNEEYQKKKK
ncbi:MAG: OmpH family outer membrane protein [Candidatus Omnitrophica bacterium]|nr:OmpH family outer membrane protein [Candidatus Omnitrophota bacterium]